MKLIFLDIDGVLVNRASFRLPRTQCEGYTATHCTAHPSCVEQLNRIVAATGARIVISSVWRCFGIKTMRELFKHWGVNAKIVGRTPEYRDRQRGDEISARLTLHAGMRWSHEPFAIIDDDADMDGLSEHLVQTTFEPGLTEGDADRVIAMLNGQQ